jgi:cell division protein FtsI (penicillin-binding protein 3)
VIQGTGRKSEVAGYEVGGKTGTAEKVGHGGYAKKALFSSFVGVFPMSDPKFLVLVSLDEPKGLAETGGYATGGMVSAPSVKAIISNMVALYGILPGDWTGNPDALQISSAPAPTAATPVAQFVPTASRNHADQHKALPAKSGGQAMAAPGVRRVATE